MFALAPSAIKTISKKRYSKGKNMNQKVIIFFAIILLAACSSSPSRVSTESPSVEPSQTSIPSPLPLPSDTPEPSPTVTPIPIGGGQLLVAFYASGSCGACIIIGDFFTGEILFEIPLSTDFQTGNIFWSPDGKSILYSDITTARMNVLLFDLETGQSKKLGDHPRKGGSPEFVNSMKYVEWSYDSEYVMYDVYYEDSNLQKSYFASKSGVPGFYESGFTDWFPDSRTMFSIYGGKDSYNVETNTFVPTSTDVLSKFNVVYILKDFILLEREKTKISVIPFPENWNDALAWQYDALGSQVVVLAQLSEEIKNGQVHVYVADKIDDNKVSVIGSVLVSNQMSYFVKIIDLKNLPVEIKPDDLLQQIGDTPLVVSPDGDYYLKGYCTFMETCLNYNPNWKNEIVRGWGFQVVGFNGVEQVLPADLSQFKGVTKTTANVINTSDGLLDGIAFYWK